LHYVLLFRYRKLNWHPNIPHIEQQSHVTQMNFFSYRLFLQNNEFSIIPHRGILFHEFIVDAWVITEQVCSQWIQTNQGILGAKVYQGLVDTIKDIANEKTDLQILVNVLYYLHHFQAMLTICLKIFKILWQLLAISNISTYFKL